MYDEHPAIMANTGAKQTGQPIQKKTKTIFVPYLIKMCVFLAVDDQQNAIEVKNHVKLTLDP